MTSVLLEPQDRDGGEGLKQKLALEETATIVIDLSLVPYLGSSALTELVRLRRRMRHSRIILRDPNVLTRRILGTVNFEELFEMQT
jgi:anti-anti-sigma regulatory factor